MNKYKKATLTLGTIGTILTPIAAVVSCGSGEGAGFNGRYDGDNDGKIVIQSTWSTSLINFKAFDQIVTQYNELKKNEPGFMPVDLQHVEGKYGDVAKQATNSFEAKDKAKLPNLFIDYSTGLASIKAYDMAIDFSKLGLERSLFDEDAIQFANNTEGVDYTKELMATPLAESTEMLATNMPLMKHFLIVLKANGATVNVGATGSYLGKIDAYDLNANSADKAAIEALWQAPTANASALSGYTVDNSTFESYEKIFEFGKKVMGLFGKQAANNSENLHVLGVDSPTSLVNAISKSLSKDSQYDGIIKMGADGYLENSWLKDGHAKDNMKKSFDMINGSLKDGSLWLGGGGDYSSNYTKEHRMALSLGSTAGYDYNYVKAAVTKKIGDVVVESFLAPKSTQTGALASIGYYKNPVWPASKDASTMGKYDIKVKNASDESKITSGNFFFKSKNPPADQTKFDHVIMQTKTGEVDYYVVKDNSQVIDSNNSDKLNKTDLLIKDNITLSATATGSDKVIVPQGPSLIGLHVNDAEDQATAMFLKFLYGSDTADFDGPDAHSEPASTPTVYFTKKSGYVVPMNGYTNNGSPIHTALTGNMGPLQALKTMGYLHDHTNGVVAGSYPTGESSIPFRNQVDAALTAAKNGAHTGHVKSTDDIYSLIANDIYWKK